MHICPPSTREVEAENLESEVSLLLLSFQASSSYYVKPSLIEWGKSQHISLCEGVWVYISMRRLEDPIDATSQLPSALLFLKQGLYFHLSATHRLVRKLHLHVSTCMGLGLQAYTAITAQVFA